MSPARAAVLRNVLIEVLGHVGSSVDVGPVPVVGEILQVGVGVRERKGIMVGLRAHLNEFVAMLGSSSNNSSRRAQSSEQDFHLQDRKTSENETLPRKTLGRHDQ